MIGIALAKWSAVCALLLTLLLLWSAPVARMQPATVTAAASAAAGWSLGAFHPLCAVGQCPPHPKNVAPPVYNGGPVQHYTIPIFIAWGNTQFPFPPQQQGAPASYLTDVFLWLNTLHLDAQQGKVATNMLSVLRQYSDISGTVSGYVLTPSVLIDGNAIPPNGQDCTDTYYPDITGCVTTSDIMAQVQTMELYLLTTRGVRPTASDAINWVWMVYLPPHVAACDNQTQQCTWSTFCAYHQIGYFDTGYPAPLIVLPYPSDGYGGATNCAASGQQTPQGVPDADYENNLAAHELAETVTDPILGQGWVSPSCGEIGDCYVWQFAPPIASTQYGSGDVLQQIEVLYELQMIARRDGSGGVTATYP